jgi:hypothetical protein
MRSIHVQGAYFSHMSNPKFHVWQGSELRASFYSSDNKELSITDKQKICEILKTPFESAWFAPTKESILTVWLPEKPTFTTQEGRKFWLLSGKFHP